MILLAIRNIVIGLLIYAFAVYVLTLRIAAAKTPAPKRDESKREALERLRRAHMAQLRSVVASPWFWAFSAIVTAMIIRVYAQLALAACQRWVCTFTKPPIVRKIDV